MFKIRILNANRQIDITSVNVFVAKLMSVRAIACTRKPIVKGTLLSNLDTRNPEMGKPIIEAIGIEKSKVPNSASLNPNVDFIVGIRDAQEEKQTPAMKKKTLRKVRCLLLESMFHTNRINQPHGMGKSHK